MDSIKPSECDHSNVLVQGSVKKDANGNITSCLELVCPVCKTRFGLLNWTATIQPV